MIFFFIKKGPDMFSKPCCPIKDCWKDGTYSLHDKKSLLLLEGWENSYIPSMIEEAKVHHKSLSFCKNHILSDLPRYLTMKQCQKRVFGLKVSTNLDGTNLTLGDMFRWNKSKILLNLSKHHHRYNIHQSFIDDIRGIISERIAIQASLKDSIDKTGHLHFIQRLKDFVFILSYFNRTHEDILDTVMRQNSDRSHLTLRAMLRWNADKRNNFIRKTRDLSPYKEAIIANNLISALGSNSEDVLFLQSILDK